jgi:hypothetical protein
MTQRASVFVGSSSEGLQVAKAVQKALDAVADVNIWCQGVFELSYSYLESLIKAIETSDFAVLVLTPDDLTQSRDHGAASPRDNVIFELGLFMGRLGRDRCFFLYDKTNDLKLPTDLLGVSAATYRPHASGNIHAAIGPACTSIEERICALGKRPRLLKVTAEDTQSSSTAPNLSGAWAGFFPDGDRPDQQNSTLEIEQHGSFVRATITREVREGTRVFDYEGRFTSGQLVLFFEDKQGRGYIVGTVVLYLSGDLRTLVGRSTYYDHTKKQVVSTSREYRRMKSAA